MPEKLIKAAQSGAPDNLKPDSFSPTLRSAFSLITQQRAHEHKKLIIAKDKNSTPPARISVDEICSFVPEQNEVALFASTNYKTYLCVGIKLHKMTQVKCLIDSGADPNLVSKLLLHSTWTSCIKRKNFSKLRNANIQPISKERVILLHLQVGKLRIRVWFRVADNLAVSVLRGTLLVEK